MDRLFDDFGRGWFRDTGFFRPTTVVDDTSRWMTDNSQLIEQVEVRSGADLLNAPVGAPEPAAAARPTATRRGRVAQ